MRVLLLLVAVCSCATRAPQPATLREPASPSDENADICRAEPQPLDAGGRAMLVALERELVGGIVFEHPGDLLFDTRDHHGLLREYAADLVLVFPEPISPPVSPFTVHVVGSPDIAKQIAASRLVFFVRLSDVEMLRQGSKRALVVHYGSGPIGRPPTGGVWLWGMAGAFCVESTAAGFRTRALGPVSVS